MNFLIIFNYQIFEIICGLVILGEASSYPKKKLIGISIGLVISCIGIFILGYKKTAIDSQEKIRELTEEPLETTAELMDEDVFYDRHKLKLMKVLAETQNAPEIVPKTLPEI